MIQARQYLIGDAIVGVCKTLKLTVVPYISDVAVSSQVLAPKIPPLGAAMVAAVCRRAGFYVDQDDLNIKLHSNNYIFHQQVGESCYFDVQRVLKFIEGKKDRHLEKTTEWILSLSAWDGFDAFLFSCYAARNFSCISILGCLGFLLKKRFPQTPVIAGGPYLTWLMSDEIFRVFVRRKALDYMIDGPGESNVVDLLTHVPDSGVFSKIPGLVYLSDGKVRRNEKLSPSVSSVGDFRGLPMDSYRHKCLAKWGRGLLREDEDILVLPYSFTNGCPFQCAFCFIVSPKKFQHKSERKVVEELFSLSKMHQTRYFCFKDATFNFDYDFTRNLCLEIKKARLDIRWSCCVHPDNLDEDLLKLMKDSGARYIVCGFETGSPRLQKYIRKNLKLDHLAAVLRIADRLGLWTGVEVICGLPYEREEDIDSTIYFLNANRFVIDECLIRGFVLTPHSVFAREDEQFGIQAGGRVDVCSNLPQKNRFFVQSQVLGFRFDETRGSSWEEKKRAIRDSYAKVLTSTEFSMIPVYEDLSYLFYFYSQLGDNKLLVKEVYQRYASILRRKAVFRSSRYLFNELSKIRSFSYAKSRIESFLGLKRSF